MRYIFYYLIFINFFSFLIYGIDKRMAKEKRRRISENKLFFCSLLGGSIGCLFGMFFFHHKTRKLKFYFWNISLLILWIVLIFYKYL